MSTYNKYGQDNQTNLGQGGTKRTQLASRNASTFNPFSFNPESQANINDYEKTQKREKQAAYRDQLDNMAQAKARDQRTNERSGVEEYLQSAPRETGQRYTPQGQDNQRHLDEEAYLREQYKKMAEYEHYQQQMEEMEKNYSQVNNLYPDTNEGNNKPETKSQHYGNQQYGSQDEASTFQQQDNQREQLLNKMRGGYSQPNSNVWSSYQKAHEAKEKDKQEFEQKLINKAVQDRQRDDTRTMNEIDRKKRLQQEAADANRKAAEIKTLEKKRQRANDTAFENQRNQDSLSQFERERYLQKENQKRLNEDVNKVLEQQVREAHTRKSDQQNPLVPSYSKMNQAQPPGKNVEALDNLSLQMNKLSMKAPYAQDDHYNPGYKQNKYPSYQSNDESRGQNRNQDFSNAEEYQKNRYRAKNTGYNILTGEFI